MKRLYTIVTIFFFMAVSQGVFADDTALYDVVNIDIPPNVLIIFDNSWSMNDNDVKDELYDPNTTYSGSRTSTRVYSRYYYSYYLFANSIDDLKCDTIKNALAADGYATGQIEDSAGGYVCGGYTRNLYMGNFLNYDASTGSSRRIDVAGDVVKSILSDAKYAKLRFGIMHFDGNDGGFIPTGMGCQDWTTNPNGTLALQNEVTNIVDDLSMGQYTPVAETLAEAGLYFAGKTTWFNSSTTGDIPSNPYTSPIDIPCRKNYIIIMTDGEPTRDMDCRFENTNYILGDIIGNYDAEDGYNEPDLYSCADEDTWGAYTYSEYLDDVAKYLYVNDLIPDYPAEGESGYPTYEKQNIMTYTIGFKGDINILKRTADNGTGTTDGSGYFTAYSYSGLQAAFSNIFASIENVNASYVAPVVPVSRTSRTFAGNSLYVGYFKPTATGRWNGNIKKYRLDRYGTLVEPDGETPVTNPATGAVLDGAYSYWYDDDCSDEDHDSKCGDHLGDGWDVTKGGTGKIMLEQVNGVGGRPARKLYTYKGVTPDLTQPTNGFTKTNITYTDLSLTTNAERDALVDDMYGAGKSWIMGDVLHSRPLVVHYDLNVAIPGDDTTFIFSGTNGGVMHCFKDDEGEEQWGFIPPDHLTELSRLTDTDTAHDYFIDGAPAIYMDSSQKILLFGERRGGEKYYALDVTDPYTPRWQYEIDSYILSIIDFDNSGFTEGAGAQLGQSWCTPKIGKMRTGAMTGQWEPVLIFGGGYDTNQDNATPNPTDSLGRAVFAVNALDKSVNVLDFNYALYNQMTHCIVDVTAVDTTGDGFINKIYAGDLGGQVFAFRDKDANGNWTARKLFVAKENSSDTVLRKIFYAPDVTRETFGDYIFFGTGNRADPNEDTVVNRVYAVQNHWDATFTDNTDTMDETDLYDATDNFIQQGAAEKRTEEEALLASKRGWFFELNPGEKVVSETIVFAGVVYFTTYEPVTSAVVNDCDVVSGSGIARLYAVDYRTGGAIYDWSPTIEKDETGEDIEGLGKSDRSLTIGTTMPSAPVIAVLEGGPQLFVGVGGGGGGGGGLFQFPPKRKVDMNLFYWWQQLSS